jgi:hypothetical protein
VRLTIAMLLAGSACGAPQTPTTEPDKVTTGDGEVICKRETPTGSHLPRAQCRPRAEVEREREAVQRELERP